MTRAGFLVVGLGNPASGYRGNRHNVGHWCADRLARRHGIELKAGRTASAGRGRIDGTEVVVAKTRVWVNESGRAIVPLLQAAGVPLSRLIVVYDELDLPSGRIRLRPKGSHGGHNGLKSIIAATASGNFARLRIGIGRPLIHGEPSWDPDAVARYVLADPPAEERAVLEAAVERACEAIETAVVHGYDRAMNEFNA
jgi:PTH1 family peptidyl-tRNA hydrolase